MMKNALLAVRAQSFAVKLNRYQKHQPACFNQARLFVYGFNHEYFL
jgi:hypothetical protein